MPLSLNRREALRVLTGAGIAGLTYFSSRWLPAAATVPEGHAKLSPELTEGPYYIDLERIRRDITEGKPGAPLRLKFRVVNGATGAAVPNAAVDVWHCDAQGVYSGFDSHSGPPGPPHDDGDGPQDGPPDGPPPGGPMDGPPQGGPPMHKPDNAQTFLRGVQLTDAHGVAEMATIFPGWYSGRTTHIHVRVHIGGKIAGNRYEGGHLSHTGQLFFAKEITDAVYALPAYARAEGDRMALEQDGIFRQDGKLLTPVHAVNPAHLASGLVAEPVLVIDPAATPAPAGFARL